MPLDTPSGVISVTFPTEIGFFPVSRRKPDADPHAGCMRIVQVIDRGLAGPGLFARLPVNKYANHLPLYRQAEVFTPAGCGPTLAMGVRREIRLPRPFTSLTRPTAKAPYQPSKSLIKGDHASGNEDDKGEYLCEVGYQLAHGGEVDFMEEDHVGI